MKKVAYHNSIEKEALEYTSKIVDFGVALLVYAALNELYNAYAILQQSHFFIHSVKKRSKRAYSMSNDKVRELKELVSDKAFAESYWDAVVDASEDDIALLRNEIESIIRNANLSDYELYSEVEVARVMLESSVIHYEEAMKDCTAKFMAQDMKGMKNLNLFQTFREFYIIDIFHEWEAVCKILYANKATNVNLTNEKTTKIYEAVADKFAKGEYIEKCFSVAKKENPEYINSKVKIEA